jgi:hypothetical protein
VLAGSKQPPAVRAMPHKTYQKVATPNTFFFHEKKIRVQVSVMSFP